MSREASLTGLDVSRETIDRLERYGKLLTSWTAKINLISRNTVDDLWTRHILDSAQLFRLTPPGAGTWLDLGSGAGLPGLIIAALAREAAPQLSVDLVEADARKAAFLQAARRTLELDARLTRIHACRIEDLPHQAFDVISARALAPLERLLPLIEPFKGPNTRIILPKGVRLDSELTLAERDWHIGAERWPSLTDPDASILVISHLERKS